jgi:hypothetical protein
MALPLDLNPGADVETARVAYAQSGACSLEHVLATPAAQRLLAAAQAWPRWNRVTLVDGVHRDFDAAQMDVLDPARRAGFEALVNRGGQEGFQYLFDNVALYDAGRAGRLEDPTFRAAFDLVRSEPFINLGRALTGVEEIRFADCQLTRYLPGHFLTRHDDNIEGKNRVAAFVLNLTPDWSADFGGVLNLLEANGDVGRGFTPTFNRLTLFKVPQPHSVSVVAPFAPAPRYAVTGWFRYGDEPDA